MFSSILLSLPSAPLQTCKVENERTTQPMYDNQRLSEEENVSRHAVELFEQRLYPVRRKAKEPR